jgi:hypothetical protein
MKTPFDHCPVYLFDPERSLENSRSIETDDYQDFLTHHQGHQLEDLKIIDDSFVSERAYSEPVKTSFFKATNGKEKFVIKKFREKIDDPLKYLLIRGDYSLKCTAIEIQAEEISKQLTRELNPPLSQNKIDAFLKLYRAIAKDVDIRDLERIPEESQYPLEIYYKLDDIRLMYLLRNCRNIFKGQEYSAMEEFIYRHKEDGVLLLKATYKIRLTETAKPRKKAIPVAFASKKDKIAAKK